MRHFGHPLRRAPALAAALAGLLLAASSGLGEETAAGAATAGDAVSLRLGPSLGKTLSPLHFAANAEFFRPGLGRGVTTQRDDLARALADSGLLALRFPGGNPAYYYLPDSRELTLQLAHATGHWEFRDDAPPSTHFVTLDQLASFCRSAGVQLIYELPCLFYLDGDTPRAIVRSTLSDRSPSLFDHSRVEEGVAYGLGIVSRLRELGAPVAAWEMGNEEFAHCSPQDYAAVVAAYVREIRKLDAATPIVPVAMGKDWLPALVPLLRDAGVLEELPCFQVHYPFGNWPGPASPDRRGEPADFLLGDVKFERWLTPHVAGRVSLGLAPGPIAVTETMVMHHQFWDPHAVIATHAHALAYAWNWMALLEHPQVNMAVFHDLESPYFGMLRYDVGFDEATRHFVWLDPAAEAAALSPAFDDQYVLSPTSLANRLLARLAGEELVATNLPPSPELRAVASRDRLVVVNRGSAPVPLEAPFDRATAQALTADGVAACLPGTYRIAPVPVREGAGAAQLTLPPLSVTLIEARGRAGPQPPR